MARKAVAASGSGFKSVGGVKVTLALFMLAVLAVTALPVCIVVIGGMVPTVVAALVDRDPRRHLSWTVGLLNLAGLVLPILKLCSGVVSLAGAQQVLMNGQNWLIMYGAAGMGWLVSAGMIPVARFIVDLRARQEERRLLERGADLARTFGREVSGR